MPLPANTSRETDAGGRPQRFLRDVARFSALLAVVLLLLDLATATYWRFAWRHAHPVRLRVDASQSLGPYTPIWDYFGADEPNYTYTPGGADLLRKLSHLDPATPVYFRTHNLLTSGDGTGALKWGSTGVYREAPDGTPIYDWKITDQIFDNFQATGIRPLVEIGFMPEALSTHPDPYRREFIEGNGDTVYAGWGYPPRDYAKWRALIVAWVTHLHERYGAQTDTWLWEVWNEPDIPYFQGSREEYERLYDVTAGAVRQVLPTAKIGGPGTTGTLPRHFFWRHRDSFLEHFLNHVTHGINADTGKPGVPLDFITFNPKGHSVVVPASREAQAHAQLNLGRHLQADDQGMRVVASFPELRSLPIVFTESDPEFCAACTGPDMAFRTGPLYAASVAEMLTKPVELARMRGVKLAGGVTWAFQYENMPWFARTRSLSTHGVDEPVMSAFRMFAKLHGERLKVDSSGAVPIELIEWRSVTGAPDIDAIATRDERSMDVLIWNYHDDDLPADPTAVDFQAAGIPATKVQITEYRMDDEHANAHSRWIRMGSPQAPSAAQIEDLKRASELIPIRSSTEAVHGGTTGSSLSLSRGALSLLHLNW